MNRNQRRAAARQNREPSRLALRQAAPVSGVSLSMARATASHQSGRLDEAENLYQQVLAVEPDHADACHLLGALAQQRGRYEESAALITKAIAAKGDVAAFHSNLGNALRASGKLDEAVKAYRRALALDPNFADAYNNLGATLRMLGNLDEAEALYRKALALNPNSADAHDNLGVVLRNQGRLADAEASYRMALGLNPNFARALYNLANVLKEQGRLEESVAAYRHALAFRPDFIEAHNNLGNALKDLGKLEEAVTCFRRVVALRADLAHAHNNLGVALEEQSELGQAAACYQRALALKPDFAAAYNNLGNVARARGQMDEAMAHYERALTLRPDFVEAHSNFLMSQHYVEGLSKHDLFAAAQRFGRSLQGLAAERVFLNDGSEDRPLRIGYVSGDFRLHPVGYFLARVLEAHDRETIETFCYANQGRSDDMTRRLRGAAKDWRTILGLPDKDAAQMILQDRIDILVDLSGHTAKNRLSLFALRPAPVQVSWLGYFGTTGLAAMDYLVMDAWAAPPGEEERYTEALVRLPYGRFCYAPPDDAPPIADPPALRRGYITYGSFNNIVKIGADVVALWASVLHATPQSRLVLKWKALDDADARDHLKRVFAAAGIEEGRLELRGFSPHAEMLAQYGDIDIALDPFPFGGGLTSCEALWMGVPVVTLPGDRPASRQTIGFLETLGLTECVATSREDYVRRAVALAGAPARLNALRREMRPRMAGSPLCDGPRFTRGLEAAFRQMWRRWSAGLSAQPFDLRSETP
jgi:protein O-GlcNAc transferase